MRDLPQYNHIMPDMWRELDASHSKIATIAVPILLHSITLAHGSDIMWRTLDRDFHSPDWKENLHYAGCSYTLWHLEPSLRKLGWRQC